MTDPIQHRLVTMVAEYITKWQECTTGQPGPWDEWAPLTDSFGSPYPRWRMATFVQTFGVPLCEEIASITADVSECCRSQLAYRLARVMSHTGQRCDEDSVRQGKATEFVGELLDSQATVEYCVRLAGLHFKERDNTHRRTWITAVNDQHLLHGFSLDYLDMAYPFTGWEDAPNDEALVLRIVCGHKEPDHDMQTILAKMSLVHKDSDPDGAIAAARNRAALLVEAFRLYRYGLVSVTAETATETTTRGVPKESWREWGSDERPLSLGQSDECWIDTAEMDHLIQFVHWWLIHRPNPAASATLPPFERRLRMALKHFAAAYETPLWQYAVLESVSGLESLLDIGDRGMTSRFSVRMGDVVGVSASLPGSCTMPLKKLYNIRSKIAHGDWEQASKDAQTQLERARERKEAVPEGEHIAGSYAAQQARRALRQAILTLTYLHVAQGEADPETLFPLPPLEKEDTRPPLVGMSADSLAALKRRVEPLLDLVACTPSSL